MALDLQVVMEEVAMRLAEVMEEAVGEVSELEGLVLVGATEVERLFTMDL